MNNQANKLSESELEEKREAISNFGIYELRALARAVGVPSPTTKKRDFLVDAIMDALNSNNVELVQKTTKGRPFKKLESMDSILSVIGDNTVKQFEIPKTYSYDDLVTFAQEIPVFEYHSEDVIKKEGVLRQVKKTCYFMDLLENVVVFIPGEFIEKYSLKNGDLVEAVAYKINADNQYCVKELIKVNNISCDEYKSFNYDNITKTLPSLSRDFNGKKVVLGGRNVLVIDEPLFLNPEISKLISDIEKAEGQVLFLGVNLCTEDQILLQRYPKLIKFLTEYGEDNLSKNFDKVIDTINLSNRLISSGENVVLIIYDIVNLLNALDLYFSNSDAMKVLGHCQQSNVIIEKLISLASAYSTGKDCTALFICNKLDIEDMFLKNQVLKISRLLK